MIKAIDAATFFRDKKRPGCIPSDTQAADLSNLVKRAASLDPSRYPLETLTAILHNENKRIGAGEKALEAIESIDGNTVFVVSGQQAGLFGGPLYTLYKAMHTVQLSRRIAEECNRTVLPVFWIASDDHDFDEVSGSGLRTGDGKSLRAEYTPPSYTEGMPVGDIMLDDGIKSAISLLAETLSHGERSSSYLDIIRSSWKPGTAWADAFAAQLTVMCGRYGLILLDPRWQGIKELFSHILDAEIKKPLASTALVNEEADKLENAGKRKKALRKPEGATNLFLEINGIRYPVLTGGRKFLAGQSSFTESELLDILNETPGRFSPAAALRPVCQDAVMPVAALIGGPGERLYLEQIRPLYDLFEVDGSIVWPRASFTLIDSRIVRVSEKERIGLERLFDEPDLLRSELAAESFPEELENKFVSLVQSVDTGFGGIAESIGMLDKTLVQAVEKEKGRVLHIIDGVKARALRAHRAARSTTEKRIKTASYFLRPESGSQERWFGADAAFMMLGGDGLDELTQLTSPGEENHRLVFIEKV